MEHSKMKLRNGGGSGLGGIWIFIVDTLLVPQILDVLKTKRESDPYI